MSNDRLANDFERLGDSDFIPDPPNWVSVRLREAGIILAADGHTCSIRQLDNLLFALADRAEIIEREGLSPLRDPRMGMVFAHATIYAAAVVEDEDLLAVVMGSQEKGENDSGTE